MAGQNDLEIMLKTDTRYCLHVTNAGNTATAFSIENTWYEED